eukprot:Gb_31942 [translate_table: standard]
MTRTRWEMGDERHGQDGKQNKDEINGGGWRHEQDKIQDKNYMGGGGQDGNDMGEGRQGMQQEMRRKHGKEMRDGMGIESRHIVEGDIGKSARLSVTHIPWFSRDKYTSEINANTEAPKQIGECNFWYIVDTVLSLLPDLQTVAAAAQMATLHLHACVGALVLTMLSSFVWSDQNVLIWPMPANVRYDNKQTFALSNDFLLTIVGNYSDSATILQKGFSRFLDNIDLHRTENGYQEEALPLLQGLHVNVESSDDTLESLRDGVRSKHFLYKWASTGHSYLQARSLIDAIRHGSNGSGPSRSI